MAKDPDYSKMSFGELLAAFPGDPEDIPARSGKPARALREDLFDDEDEATPPDTDQDTGRKGTPARK